MGSQVSSIIETEQWGWGMHARSSKFTEMGYTQRVLKVPSKKRRSKQSGFPASKKRG